MLFLSRFILSSPLWIAFVSAGATISDPNNPPEHSEQGQAGYNDCAHRGDSPSSQCQTAWMNSLDDFCLFAPPNVESIGDSERYEVAYCSKAGHGARLMPSGAIHGAHFVKTPHFIQVTGVGDLTKLNTKRGDDGGELDPHGADGNGNPIGGLLLGEVNGQTIQFKEWTEFISDHQFCIRACYPGPDAYRWCNHIVDVMGCDWNMPANYDTSRFETCEANDPAQPMGVYKLKDGSLSTWYQGVKPTPAAQPVPASSQCTAIATVGGAAYPAKKTRRTAYDVETGRENVSRDNVKRTHPGNFTDMVANQHIKQIQQNRRL